MRSRITSTTHLTQTCSCFRMRVEILTKIQALLIPLFTLLSSPLLPTWPKTLMTSVSWRHLVPEERLGFTHLWIHNKETETIFWLIGDQRVFQDLDQEPVVKQLTSDPVEIKNDHFSQPLDGTDSSHGAMNFPIPEVRYLIKEISVIWHLYGGKDFGSAAFTASPARSRGWGSSCSIDSFSCVQKKIIFFFFF